MRKIFAFLFVIISFSSCSQNKLTIVLDPWWETAYDAQKILKKEIFYGTIRSRKQISKVIAGTEEELDKILESIERRKGAQVVIASPALYSILKNRPNSEKKINYIILNGFYGNFADNLIAVYSSRKEEYYQAGIKAALFSTNNDNCSVAAVFYNGSLVKRLEKDRFVEGFNSINNRGDLNIYEQQTYTGGDKLKEFINSAPENGAGLFFFSASSLNPYCLELALPLSISISGENLNSSGIYNELLEFSVDDDIIEIIKIAVRIGLDGDINDDFPVKALVREKGIHF